MEKLQNPTDPECRKGKAGGGVDIKKYIWPETCSCVRRNCILQIVSILQFSYSLIFTPKSPGYYNLY